MANLSDCRSAKRTFIVEALVQNSKNELKPGSYARALLPTDKNERVLLVPAKAVTYLFGANKTYVVRNGATVEAREVKIGDRIDNDVEILDGLQEGDLVATSQLGRLDTGVRVSVRQPEPAKAASAARKAEFLRHGGVGAHRGVHRGCLREPVRCPDPGPAGCRTNDPAAGQNRGRTRLRQVLAGDAEAGGTSTGQSPIGWPTDTSPR